ncbi:MAG TPA: MFS transporter [Terracidiphilus sp.]|nr:MFS transporter [Terracidiphilus sp.]
MTDLTASARPAPDHPSSNRRLAGAALVCSLGGLVFGYDLGALSAASQNLRDFFGLAPGAFGLTISASLWGTVCGAPLAGAIVDRLGRRALIGACALIYAFAAIGMALPFTAAWSAVLALRVAGGAAIGGFTVGCPLYLAELAPDRLRGRLVSLFQVQVGVGVVAAFALGALLLRITSTAGYWRWCFGVGAVPAVLLLSLLWALPRDPRHFARRSEPVAGGSAGQQPDGELVHERLFQRKYLRPLAWATSVAVFNQLSGVNILLLYLLEVLSSAGLGRLLGHTYTVWISSLSLAFTFAGLSFIDRLGRKPLLILGSAGMFACLAALAAAIPLHIVPAGYLLIIAAYNLCFAFSQGTVVWVYLSELFPPAVRGAGQGYGATVHWVANAALIWLFPIVQHAAPAACFYGLAAMMAVQIAVVWLWYPETRGAGLGAVA